MKILVILTRKRQTFRLLFFCVDVLLFFVIMVVTQRQVLSFYCWLPQELSNHGTAFNSLHYVVKTVFPPSPPPLVELSVKRRLAKRYGGCRKGRLVGGKAVMHITTICVGSLLWLHYLNTPPPPPPSPHTHTQKERAWSQIMICWVMSCHHTWLHQPEEFQTSVEFIFVPPYP